MRQSHPYAWASGCCILAAAGLFVAHAKGLDLPDRAALNHAGVLETPDGELVSGPKNLELRLGDAQVDGETLCASGGVSVNLVGGRFSLPLPALHRTDSPLLVRATSVAMIGMGQLASRKVYEW